MEITHTHLPERFSWGVCDPLKDDDMTELCEFLHKNYMNDGQYYTNYTPEFVKWSLTFPDYDPKAYVCVRYKSKSGVLKLAGFIAGLLQTFCVDGAETKGAYIDYLSVLKKLRKKGLAPVIISELIKYGVTIGVKQSIYISAIAFPHAFTQSTTFVYPINVAHLTKIGKMQEGCPPDRFPVSDETNQYHVPELADVPSLCMLINKYLSRFRLHSIVSQKHIEHLIDGVKSGLFHMYVLKNKTGDITDLISFDSHEETRCDGTAKFVTCGAYYNIHTTVKMRDLVMDAISLAKRIGADLYKLTDIMDNIDAISALPFCNSQQGFYFYSHNCELKKKVTPSDVAMITP